MSEFIVKDNVALVLFGMRQCSLPDREQERKVWSKILSAFHYDPQADFNFLYIDGIGSETIVGFSLRAEPHLISMKANRYAQGLAYLVTHYFLGDVRLLSQDEALALTERIFLLTHGQQSLPQTIHTLFARVIDPAIMLDKLHQFYQKEMEQSHLEQRMGVKSPCDQRMLAGIVHPYLAYSFHFFPTEQERVVDLSRSTRKAKPLSFTGEFFEFMMVPDSLLELVKTANSSADLFDNEDLVVVTPETVADFVLGIR